MLNLSLSKFDRPQYFAADCPHQENQHSATYKDHISDTWSQDPDRNGSLQLYRVMQTNLYAKLFV
jgi:hypothetical protein